MKIDLTEVESRWDPSEERWRVVIDARFANRGAETFELDKTTACDGGAIYNDVFVVQSAGTTVAYQGIMMKRAHPGPDGFHRLAPGESIVERIDLGASYAFAADGGTFTVRFDHFNHFSANDVQLISTPITVVLDRSHR